MKLLYFFKEQSSFIGSWNRIAIPSDPMLLSRATAVLS
jgi:hypothetical protein